jgi:hypothetical protein
LKRRIAMSRIVITVMALIAMLAVGFDASAQSKKCPKGYYYDEETGKCIARRGSG